MDISNNFISNVVNEENINDLPNLIPMDVPNLIPLLPSTPALLQSPTLSTFGENQNSFWDIISNDLSNNRNLRNRIRQRINFNNNNIIYQPNALYASPNTMNNIVQQSFQEPGTLYKHIVSDKGKKNIDFSIFDGKTEEICAITRCSFEKGEEIATLPCKHVFNKNAIMTWLENKSSECPICRYKLDEKEIKKEIQPANRSSVRRGPVARARLRNALYDMLDRRLQEDEEERLQRAILLSLRESIGDEGTNID